VTTDMWFCRCGHSMAILGRRAYVFGERRVDEFKPLVSMFLTIDVSRWNGGT
jgi:hypothetical protein